MSKKSKKSTALATYTGTPQEALTRMREQLATLVSIENSTWKTNGQFPANNGGHMHLKNPSALGKTTEKAMERLITMGGLLDSAYENYTNSAEKGFGLTEFPAFSLNGNSHTDWWNDLRLSMAILTSEAKRTQLEADIQKTETFISKEESKAMHMEEMANKYGFE